eukprot:2475779-Amphidinium_carterae.1
MYRVYNCEGRLDNVGTIETNNTWNGVNLKGETLEIDRDINSLMERIVVFFIHNCWSRHNVSAPC